LELLPSRSIKEDDDKPGEWHLMMETGNLEEGAVGVVGE
jgi:hypothetical protein